MNEFNFLVFGGATSHYILKVDYIGSNDETIYLTNNQYDKLFLGGTGLNIAYSLANLGSSCTIIGSTNKKYGACAVHSLKKMGVNTDNFSVVEGSGTSYIIEDARGKRLTILSQEIESNYLCPMPEQLFLEAPCAILSVGSRRNTARFLSKLIEFNTPFAFSMRSDRTVFTDDILRMGMLKAEYVFCNDFERQLIEKVLGLKHIRELLTCGKAKAINVTRGSEGSTLYQRDDGGKGIHIMPGQVQQVVDCTGAGDAYVAGFMYGVSMNYDFVKCARLGATMSSFIIQELGCVTGSPSLKKLLCRYNSRPDVRN